MQTEIITILGTKGCGKTSLTKILETQFPARVIVFDKMKQWEVTSPHTFVVDSVQSFQNIWRNHFHENEFTIIVHFPFGSDLDTTMEMAAAISELIYKTGVQSGLETLIIFEEVQFYIPNYHLPGAMLEILTTSRHARINMIANTQRPASVNKLLISLSDKVFVGRLFEKRDIEYLRDSVGEIAEKARSLQKFEFIYYVVGSEEETIVTLNDAQPL